MPTGVFVGEQFPFEPPDKPLHRPLAAREGKLDRFAFIHLLHRCDLNTRHGRKGNVNGHKNEARIAFWLFAGGEADTLGA